ncbi:hypothetical protein SADUNF_Sadunf02G0194200 [Salix dunnii]|uniref:Endoplasmic reticulum transmembrane protein n=1 Tax=Salix dunnii TaxID=1413687 RepID=A0A835N987_9ROSI|nr:hypothetical protein SADUNF_Sadunf02G0194200 [Salix dunnii]
MIQLLFLVIFAEGVVAFLLLVKIGPLRELVMKSLDQVKMGKRPATVKTIAGTMSVILFFSLMNIVKIQNKGAKLGTMSPMDQVLWRTHLLEASLMGIILFFSLVPLCLLVSLCFLHLASYVVFGYVLDGKLLRWKSRPLEYNEKFSTWPASHGMILAEYRFAVKMSLTIAVDVTSFCLQKSSFTLFLGFLIDRMHHYLSKLIGLRSTVGSSKAEVERLQEEKMKLKEKEDKASKEMKLLQEQSSTLSENLKKLKLESEHKDKQIETAEAHVVSLQKQCADLLLEYDRLLEDNQNLQAQATRQRI